MVDKINPKHEAVLSKAAAVIRARGHEGDARLADSVTGVLASLRQQANRRAAQPADVGAVLEESASASIGEDGLPDGWVIVPKMPTAEMQMAAMEAARKCDLEDGQPRPLPRGYELWSAMFVYQSMLAAAPPLSSEQQPENMCRSCNRSYTKMGRINAAGHCPHCGVEITEGTCG